MLIAKTSDIDRSERKILNVFDVDKFEVHRKIEIDNNLLFKH